MDCIFCKIIAGEIPCDKVFETETVLAFKDINPAAEEHILIIPKKHIESVDDINESHSHYLFDMFIAARKIAELKDLSRLGYRLIVNNGEAAGQMVFHLHMHILGGRMSLGPMIEKIRAQ